MSCKEEVLRIGKKLEKMIKEGTSDHAQAVDILKTLKKQPITLDVLQKTHIGMIVNNFRKATSNEEVISVAKSIIKSWKKLLPDSSSQKSDLNRSNSTTSQSEESQQQDDEGSPTAEKSSNNDDEPKQKSFPSRAEDTSDSIRLKCRDMLTKALKTEPIPDLPEGTVVEDIAAAIETCIFDEFKNTESKYKNRIRSRYSNLKDSRNPDLRANVLTGNITAERLATMTPEDMANKAMKELRAKFTKESIDDHQMSVTGGTTTDLLKCGKCGRRSVTYNQVQTRSADEPMTTFCLCNDCGNRWKFC